jgi:hypothetical protein
VTLGANRGHNRDEASHRPEVRCGRTSLSRAELEAEATALINQATGATGNDERVMVSPELKTLLMEYCVSDGLLTFRTQHR